MRLSKGITYAASAHHMINITPPYSSPKFNSDVIVNIILGDLARSYIFPNRFDYRFSGIHFIGYSFMDNFGRNIFLLPGRYTVKI